MDIQEQNRIASENKKQRDITNKLDHILIMLQSLSEQIADLEKTKGKKKD